MMSVSSKENKTTYMHVGYVYAVNYQENYSGFVAA